MASTQTPDVSPRGPVGGAHGAPKPSLGRAMAVFSFRDYRYLWISSAFAFASMQMQQVARGLLAWDLTGEYAAIGWVVLSFGAPMVIFGLVGGSLADRFDKRNLVLVTQVACSILMFITAVLVATHTITIWQLVIIGVLQGTFFAFGMPARTPLMAEVVGEENVMSAIAMANAAMNMTRLIGPALAGLLIGVWGMEFAYWAQSAMYAFAAVTLLFVPAGRNARTRTSLVSEVSTVFVEIAGGLAYVARDRQLRLLIGMLLVVSILANPYVMLLAGYVQRDLNAGLSAYGYLNSIAGIGALVSSVGIATVTEYDRKPLIQWTCGVLSGVGLILLTLASRSFGLPGTAVAVVLLGFSVTAYQTLNNTMLMNTSRPEYYGRVMSMNMVAFNMMPLMTAPMGALADHIGGGQLFIIMGGTVLACMAIAAVVNRKYTFGAMPLPAWRLEDRGPSAVTVRGGVAATRLHAPVDLAAAVPSGDGEYGFPAPTGATQDLAADAAGGAG